MSTDSDTAAALKDAVKEALHDILSASMRPAVIASDSGVSSCTLETMSNGTTKILAKICHEDPREAFRLARELYESEMLYWTSHGTTNIVPPKR